MTLNSIGFSLLAELILQKLIQFNTTNPPGSERECILYINKVLEDVGIEVKLYARDEDRPNSIARIPGRVDALPLLLYGHVDVVTTKGQTWTHPPFEGKIVDGYISGHGALDIKGGIVMIISTLLRLKAEKIVPAGDTIFMILSDEENNGFFGALYMVEEYFDLFDEVRYALGKFGGSNIQFAGTRFYPDEGSR